MKYVSLIFAGSALLATTACNSSAQSNKDHQESSTANRTEVAQTNTPQSGDDGFIKSPDGLDYKLITKGTGTQTPKPGDLAEMHVKFRIGDTVMINTYEMNNQKPVTQQCQAPSMKGDLMEGLMRMKAGDSMVFRMLMDTLATRANQPKPAWAKPGDYAVWEIKMVSVKTKEQAETENAKNESAQLAIDDKILQDYFKSKKIKNVKKMPSGIYYVVQKPGTGVSPKAGQKVSVNYTGQDLKGEKFDSNVDPSFNHVEPFSFDLGKHNVIKGWDEAVAIMKKGMKATFYIPSSLAYGSNGAGGKIPPNAILIFDIELLSFK
jgi:FKBP-type peptidyl-prolyl cis-trans isomerase FkpA